MKLVSLGKGGKVHNMKVSRTVIVTDDLPQIDSLIEIQENGEIINLDAEGNEVHTPESYANKITSVRNKQISDLELEISNLKNQVTQAKLIAELNQMKALPYTIKGQWAFENALSKFKEFAMDLGAKVVAEIAMKQLGY